MGGSNPTRLTPKLGSSTCFHWCNLHCIYSVETLGAVETLRINKKHSFIGCSQHQPTHSGLLFDHPTKKLLSSVHRSTDLLLLSFWDWATSSFKCKITSGPAPWHGQVVGFSLSVSAAQGFAGSSPGRRYSSTHQAVLGRHPTCHN